MGDQDEEDFEMAIRISMQPEPKRSKPRDVLTGGAAASNEFLEEPRKLQRELMAMAAEKRMMANTSVQPSKINPGGRNIIIGKKADRAELDNERTKAPAWRELSENEGSLLFSMLFGDSVSKDVLAQWTNQGVRFSPEPETSIGLVQHEGGPCGVLAAIQAFVLKHIIFFPQDLGKNSLNPSLHPVSKIQSKGHNIESDVIVCISEDVKARALVKSMGEILFLCGSGESAVIATVSGIDHHTDSFPNVDNLAKMLEGISVESPTALQKILRVNTFTSQEQCLKKLEEMIPVFQSRMGALLFLISALLSRRLDMVQADRDDPTLPLVTAPFGHASQEIVNLLLSGRAVPNVFDGRMDLGGGMFLKGISTSVEVGFLTLLESLNFCKVGRYLKCPNWPIWVIGSESHYTVLFALDCAVQNENELEERETEIRKSFNSHDQSGGGGFIGVERFHQLLREANIRLPPEKIESLCNSGFIVWSEFWQAIVDLDKSLGGLKDSSELMGKKLFELYHFNGIAKSDLNGNQPTCGGDTPLQRPRLTKLSVSVPPRWTPGEYMADVLIISSLGGNGADSNASEVSKPEISQHAPLVDCIRTRWPRAMCNWIGDSPSIV